MFQIFVDSAANLPAVTAKQYDINVISFVNLVDGKEIIVLTRIFHQRKNVRKEPNTIRL